MFFSLSLQPCESSVSTIKENIDRNKSTVIINPYLRPMTVITMIHETLYEGKYCRIDILDYVPSCTIPFSTNGAR